MSAGLKDSTLLLPSQPFHDLAQLIGGEVLLPGSSGYEEAISVWNAQVKARPQVVVRARGVSDVLAAVKYATTHKIQLSVKAGGHSMRCLCDGLVIDLSKASSSIHFIAFTVICF